MNIVFSCLLGCPKIRRWKRNWFTIIHWFNKFKYGALKKNALIAITFFRLHPTSIICHSNSNVNAISVNHPATKQSSYFGFSTIIPHNFNYSNNNQYESMWCNHSAKPGWIYWFPIVNKFGRICQTSQQLQSIPKVSFNKLNVGLIDWFNVVLSIFLIFNWFKISTYSTLEYEKWKGYKE